MSAARSPQTLGARPPPKSCQRDLQAGASERWYLSDTSKPTEERPNGAALERAGFRKKENPQFEAKRHCKRSPVGAKRDPHSTAVQAAPLKGSRDSSKGNPGQPWVPGHMGRAKHPRLEWGCFVRSGKAQSWDIQATARRGPTVNLCHVRGARPPASPCLHAERSVLCPVPYNKHSGLHPPKSVAFCSGVCKSAVGLTTKTRRQRGCVPLGGSGQNLSPCPLLLTDVGPPPCLGLLLHKSWHSQVASVPAGHPPGSSVASLFHRSGPA